MSSDGTVIPETKYQDICYELNYVRVAANFEKNSLELENKNGFYDFLRPAPYINSDYSFIGWFYEVVDAFFVHFNVIPIYSDLNQTWGWYDNETELWTGGVGAVMTSPKSKSQSSPKSTYKANQNGRPTLSNIIKSSKIQLYNP